MTEPDQLRIISVWLIPESYKTYRVRNGNGLSTYPVSLFLSEPLSVYGLLELSRDREFKVDFENPQEVLLPDFALEAVQSRFADLTATIRTAAARGQRAQREAEAEDGRLAALRDEINNQIPNL